MATRSTTIILGLWLCAASAVRGQDGHLSHYDAAPQLLNPALTGMYENGDFRMTSNVRSQWNSLSGGFVTTGFGYDLSMQKRYGFGSYLQNYNQAGIVNTFQFGLSAAYNVSDSKAKHTLSGGLNVGLIYKKVNDQQLVWDAQYSDGHFDTDLPSGENIMKGARLMPELALGVAYRSADDRKRLNPFGNAALFHVTTPDESIFSGTASDLPIRYSANAGVRVEVMDGIYLIPNGLYMRQGADQEVNVGMLGEVNLMGSVYSAVAGGSYRLNDAVIIQLGLKHKNAMYRFSYDVNTSPLGTYTRKNGAFEFSLVYYGTHSGRERRTVSSAF